MNEKKLELYIHIPFCVKKCDYCDFLSFPADSNTQIRYVHALLQEIRYYGICLGIIMSRQFISEGARRAGWRKI